MKAPWELAREIQKPPPAGALNIVNCDTKEDQRLPNEVISASAIMLRNIDDFPCFCCLALSLLCMLECSGRGS